MDLSRQWVVTRQLGRSLARVAADAARPHAALPLSESRAADPLFLQGLLSEYGIGKYSRIAGIQSVRLLDIRSVSSNCNNRVLELQYSDKRAPWPRTMFLKMPVRSFATRVFMGTIMSWELECEFYRKVAPRLPVRTPTAYAMANHGSRMIMLMENLYDDPSVVLHTNPEMIVGPSLDTARQCLQTMARIHAEFHDISKAERDTLLPPAMQPFSSPVMRALTPMMGRAALNNCRKRADLGFSAQHIAWYEKALAHWDQLVNWWTQGPLTLVHGDSHIGNHFSHGDDAGMLDWQAAQWGKGIRDVQYFLTDSLPADVLADNEEALVQYYLEMLAANGVQLDFSETWYQYRSFSFQTWMTIVVSMGFAVMTEDMNEVMPEIHRRCIASIQRLELGKLLAEILD